MRNPLLLFLFACCAFLTAAGQEQVRFQISGGSMIIYRAHDTTGFGYGAGRHRIFSRLYFRIGKQDPILFNRNGKAIYEKYISSNKEALDHFYAYKKHHTCKTVSEIAGFAGIPVMIAGGLTADHFVNPVSIGGAGLFLAGCIVAIVQANKAMASLQHSFHTYNSGLPAKTSMRKKPVLFLGFVNYNRQAVPSAGFQMQF